MTALGVVEHLDVIEHLGPVGSRMRWLCTYNHERPNMALGGIRPAMKLAMAAYLQIWRTR
ncbi:hypothetical protein EX530_21530 [Xanthomonas phaseoli]